MIHCGDLDSQTLSYQQALVEMTPYAVTHKLVFPGLTEARRRSDQEVSVAKAHMPSPTTYAAHTSTSHSGY